MSRRHDFCAVGHRSIEQRGELQVAVAVRARNRRAAGDVLVDEVRHDRPLKLALEIDDVVRDVEAPGHTAGVVEVVEAAAAAIAGLAVALVVELHRQADNLVARLGQQRRGHG